MGNTLLGDYFAPDKRAKWLMWQGIVGSVCGSGLLALSGFLAGFGWNFSFLVYGLALVIAVAAYFFLFEPERPQKNFTPSGTFIEPRFPRAAMIRLASTTFILAALYFVYTLQFSLALDELGLKQAHSIGNYSAVASFAVPLGAILFKLLSSRRSVFQFTVLFMLLGAGMVGIGLSRDINTVVAFAFVQQLGAGMCIPILIGWGLREMPDEFRGRGMGLWTSAFFLGQFLSPFFVSVMRGLTGGLLPTFVACGAICIAIAVGNLLLNGRRTPATARPLAR